MENRNPFIQITHEVYIKTLHCAISLPKKTWIRWCGNSIVFKLTLYPSSISQIEQIYVYKKGDFVKLWDVSA